MSPLLKIVIWSAVIVTIYLVIGQPIIDWFDQVSDAAAQSSQTHTEIR